MQAALTRTADPCCSPALKTTIPRAVNPAMPQVRGWAARNRASAPWGRTRAPMLAAASETPANAPSSAADDGAARGTRRAAAASAGNASKNASWSGRVTGATSLGSAAGASRVKPTTSPPRHPSAGRLSRSPRTIRASSAVKPTLEAETAWTRNSGRLPTAATVRAEPRVSSSRPTTNAGLRTSWPSSRTPIVLPPLTRRDPMHCSTVAVAKQTAAPVTVAYGRNESSTRAEEGAVGQPASAAAPMKIGVGGGNPLKWEA